MSDQSDQPNVPKPRRFEEYEDPHYHDDESEIVPTDDIASRGPQQPLRRKRSRKLPQRRHYDED